MATTPRMKITYATLSADNEELQSAFDAALERARAELGRTYPMLIGGEERDSRRDVRGSLARSTASSSIARFPKGTRQDVARRHRGRAGCIPGLARHAVARSAGDRPPSGRADQRAPVRLRRPHGARGRQEPPRGARRRRGDRRPAALLQRRVREGRRLREADGLALGGGEDALGSPAIWRLRRHQPLQLPDGPGRRSGWRRDDRRQHGRAEAELGRAAHGLEVRRGRCARPACRRGSSTS